MKADYERQTSDISAVLTRLNAQNWQTRRQRASCNGSLYEVSEH